MASIEKRGANWRVVVSNKGQKESATFPSKMEAKAWGAQKEAEFRTRKLTGIVPNKTVGDVLDEYLEKVSPTKKGHDWERKRISVLKGYRIASVRLSDLDSTHVSKWRDDRLKDVSGSSVCRDWNLLSHAVETAKREWKWISHNPFKGEVTRPKVNPARDKVYTDEQIEMICIACSIKQDCSVEPCTVLQRVGYAFLFAIETGMRAGEIVSLTKDNVYERFVRLPLTKNGSARDVPLSSKASVIIEKCLGDGTSVFNLTSRQLDASFRQARNNAGLQGYTFHDSRATALTRMAKILTNPLDLAKVSGHRSLTILLNTYYRPTVEDLADALNAGKPEKL